MTDIDQLKDELRYCIANNEDRPRTEAALRWALESVEAIEARRVIAESEKAEVRA